MNINGIKGIASIALFVFLLCMSNSLKASHAVGADLTYKCIDPAARKYEVQLTFYRDCYGVDASSYVTINYSSISCGQSGSVYAYPIPGTGQEISPVCDIASTTCSGGSNPGIQEYVYTAEITLPSNCPDWKFSYRVGNRNAMINTISSPSSEYMYVEAELDNSTYSNNNSPTFTNKPVPFICAGQNFCFNHGARDEDGDSLVYSLISPFSDEGVTVNYLFGYSSMSPLDLVTPMSFDSQSGSFCVTPSKIEVTVMAVRVDEYRNGTKIGSVIRDMQVIVRNCSNDLPSVDGINGTGIFEDTICAHQPYCFDINTIDPNMSQNLTLDWNEGIDGASFNPGSGKRPTGEFCWTPDGDDVSTLPHYFTVTVRDDNCTYNGLQTYAFKIYVQDLKVDAGPDKTVNCGSTVDLEVDYSSAGATYSWNNGMTGKKITVDEAGEYIVTVDDGGCAGVDTVVVTWLDAPEITLSPDDSIFCSEEKTITAVTDPPGLTVTWEIGGTGNSIDVDSPGDYVASVSYNGCTIYDTTNIKKLPMGWDIKLAYSYGCSGDSTYFTDRQSTTSNGSSFDSKWTIEGNVYNADSINYLFTTAGSFPVKVELESPEGCKFDTTFTVDVFDKPQADFTLDSGCVGEQLLFDDKTVGTVATNVWLYGDGSGTSNAFSVTHTYLTAGTFPVTLYTQGPNGCIDSITHNITVNNNPSVDFTPPTPCAGDEITLTGSTTPSTGLNLIWTVSNGDSFTGNNIKTSIDAGGIYNIKLKATDDFGCADSVTKNISVKFAPGVTLNGIELCQDETLTFGTSTTNVSAVHWDFGDGTSSTAASSDKAYETSGNFIVDLTITSIDGCINNDTAMVVVHSLPSPDIKAGNYCQATNMDLATLMNGTNATNTFDWYVDGVVYNGEHALHSFTKVGSNLVVLMETTPFGCFNFDTTTVEIAASPVVNIKADTLYGCSPLEVNFSEDAWTVSGIVDSWEWNIESLGKANSKHVNSVFTKPGLYDVSLTVTDDKGCEGTTTMTDWIEIFDSPTADFEFAKSVLDEEDNTTWVNNLSSDASTYSWLVNGSPFSTQTDIEISFTDVDEYPVKLYATNTFGCVDSITRNINLNPKYNFFIPSAFSPNNDGKNEIFFGKGENYKEIQIWVYNRWGTVVYEYKGGVNFGWNGLYNNDGKECQQDVYVYKSVITDWSNKKHEKSGTVTLLR